MRRGSLAVLVPVILLVLMLSVSPASATFEFNGTVRDESGTPLNDSVVNITVRNVAGWSIVGYNTTTSNASGWFNISIANNSAQWLYEPSITKKNATFNHTEFRSKTLPAFPQQMIEILAGTTFYLAPAGTINITAVNASGARIPFKYQVKDTRLGYPIASNFDALVNDAVVSVPRARNYSIMVYPNDSMPVSFNWNNFTSSSSYTINASSSYNVTTRTLHKQFNTTLSLVRVSGYANASVIPGWDELTVVPYLVEPGNMVHAQYGTLPYNISSSNQGQTDAYNRTRGFYNITLPATVETSSMLLFATARNGSAYYGGIQNISLAYGSGAVVVNFTMYGLVGNPANISMDRAEGGSINITTAKQTFAIVNASNRTLGNVSAHIETTLDYSSYGSLEFTWMSDVQQSDAVATFALPLLNATGIKEMNVYVSGGQEGGNGQFAPRRISRSIAELAVNPNISVSLFNPEGIDAQIGAGNINIGLYVSNTTCDVPTPAQSCILGSSQQEQNMSEFNPMQAVMGGGKISFRMGTGNISVHYVNVDLLASGPPDALFDSSTSNTSDSNSFSSAVRFGSNGPTIYDYVLVSIPYTESAGSGLNDSAAVNMSIGILYDDSWNAIWNTTANGTNAAALAGNASHYAARQSEWAYLLNSSTCHTNMSSINETAPCYINTTTNRIWVRLPHFSGTRPTLSGTSVPAASSPGSSSSSSSGGGGGGTTASYWKSTVSVSAAQLTARYAQTLGVQERVQLIVGGATHHVGVVALSGDSVTVNVSSTPQQATLKVGENKSFELTNDSFYDLKVTLHSILANKANMSFISVSEPVVALQPPSSATPQSPENGTGETTPSQAENKQPTRIWRMVTAIVVVLLIILSLVMRSRRRRHS